MKTKPTLPNFKKCQFLLISLPLLFFSQISIAQTQVGNTIIGEEAFSQSGFSVSMPDAYTLAIGAVGNDGNGVSSGHVRIHTFFNNQWLQKGTDIDGESSWDHSGNSISMPDSNMVAIGATGNDDNGSNSGHVRVYKWNGSAWVQRGRDIDGEAADDLFGSFVSMPDTITIAIGAVGNDGNGYNAGRVKVYKWNGNAWVQKGSNIDGEMAGDASGVVSMPDSNTIALGAVGNDGNGSNSGHTRIFRWNGQNWIQKGVNIDGEQAGDSSGYSVSMPDSNTVAVGAPKNDHIGTDEGHVRVFYWDGNSWIQKGSDINGVSNHDNFGFSVSMANNSTIAIGASHNDGNGYISGQVQIYSWNGSSWVQKGIDVYGLAGGDYTRNVSMPDEYTAAIGSPEDDGFDSGVDEGYVRVFSYCNGAIDSLITYINDTLISNDRSATYQWVNCDSVFSPIFGETSQKFIPTSSGSYAVIISKSHCVDTSKCYVVSSLSELYIKAEQFTVYPNPTKGIFTIESDLENKNISYVLRNITGKVVLKGKLSGNRASVDLSEYSSGVYLLRVGNQNIKLVRE